MKDEEKIHIDIALIKQEMGFMSKILVSIEEHLKTQNGKVNSHGIKISWILGVGGGAVGILGLIEFLVK